MAGTRELRIQIIGDANSATRAFSRLESDASSLSVKLEGLGGAFSRLGSVASAAVSGIAFAATTAALQKLGDAYGAVMASVIDTNANLETSAVSWGVLLGSTDAANKKIQELYAFAAATPFDFPEVQKAALLLQTFGGAALNSGENLTLVGDIAAGVNQPFGDVAMWYGRMYDAIQNGRPFGEAAARLQEMGAMSGATRNKLEDMQKQGVSGAKIWGTFTGEMGRFGGLMEKQSHTYTGLASTFQDLKNQLFAVAGKPIFDHAKKSLESWNAILSSPRAMQIAEQAAAFLQKGYDQLDKVMGRLLPAFRLTADAVVTVGQAASGNWFGGQTQSINGFVRVLGRLTQLARDAAITFVQAFKGEWFGAATQSINPFVRALGIVATTLGGLFRNVQALFRGDIGIQQFGTNILATFGQLFANIQGWVKSNGPAILALLGSIFSGLGTVLSTVIGPALGGLWTAISTWVTNNKAGIQTTIGTLFDLAQETWSTKVAPALEGFRLSMNTYLDQHTNDFIGMAQRIGKWLVDGIIIGAGLVLGTVKLAESFFNSQFFKDVDNAATRFVTDFLIGIGREATAKIAQLSAMFTTPAAGSGAVAGANFGQQFTASASPEMARLLLVAGKIGEMFGTVLGRALSKPIGMAIEGVVQRVLELYNKVMALPFLGLMLSADQKASMQVDIPKFLADFRAAAPDKGAYAGPLLTPEEIASFSTFFSNVPNAIDPATGKFLTGPNKGLTPQQAQAQAGQNPVAGGPDAGPLPGQPGGTVPYLLPEQKPVAVTNNFYLSGLPETISAITGAIDAVVTPAGGRDY